MSGEERFPGGSVPAVRLLRTKLFAPHARRDVVPRTRLLRKLNAGQRARLILIAAPAGYGKTTLLAEWISQLQPHAAQSQTGKPVAWVSLDGSDNDPVRFWAYLTSALGNARPGLGQSALALVTGSPRLPPTEAFLTGLINEITEIREDLVLVLDDYHAIVDETIHTSVSFLVDNLPPQMQLVIASRHEPPIPLARLRGMGELVELRAADLRFSSEEAAALLNQVMGLTLTPGDLAALEARTEGWAAGLQLAALSMQGIEDAANFIRGFSGSHRFVFDYLAQEVLQRQPVPVRTFLLRTSILERLCGSLCDAVVGATGPQGRDGDMSARASQPADSQAVLEYLERSNLFLIPLDQERRWYRYHHLFGSFLRSRLAQAAGTSELAELHLRASLWHEQHGDVDEAIEHALAGDHHKRSAALMVKFSRDLNRRNALDMFAAWLPRIPGEVMDADPTLCLAGAWAVMATGHPVDEVERFLCAVERAVGQPAEVLAVDGGKLPGAIWSALAEVSIMRSTLALNALDIPRALELTRRVQPWLARDDLPVIHNSPATMRPVVAFQRAMALELDGQTASAAKAFAEAAELGQRQMNQHITALSLSHLGQALMLQGQLHRAEETYRHTLQVVHQMAAGPSPFSAIAHAGLGILQYEWDDVEAAVASFDRAASLGKSWQNYESLLPAYAGLARARWAQGDIEGALAALRQLDSVVAKSGLSTWSSAVETIRATIELRLGGVDRAARWAETAGFGPDSRVPYLREGDALLVCRTWLATGRNTGALQLMASLREAAAWSGRYGRVLEATILQALAWQAEGAAAQALTAIAEALSLAEPEGYVRLFLDEGPPMLALLRAAAAAPAPALYARHLMEIAARQASALVSQKPGKPSTGQPAGAGQSAMSEPLTARELDVLRCIAGGLKTEEIADHLVLSTNTVKTHIKNIYSKLDAGSRTQAVARARSLNLL